MKEMNDYSGPFKPDARWEDFSKDFLIKIMRLWQQAYLDMAGMCYMAVEKRCGFDTAVACEDEAWNRVVERMTPKYVKAANIQLNTALDSLKVLQLPAHELQHLNSERLPLRRARTSVWPGWIVSSIPKSALLERRTRPTTPTPRICQLDARTTCLWRWSIRTNCRPCTRVARCSTPSSASR